MKRITKLFLTAAVVLFAGSVFAQDMTQAGELYQKATEAYQAGNEMEAVKNFKEALKIAQAAGDDGIEMAQGCRDMIPQILMSAAGKMVADKDYVKAEETYTEALNAATEYGNDAVVANAKTKLAQIPLQQGNDAYTAGNMDEAIALFQKAVERDGNNAKAHLLLGMAYNKANKDDEAEASLMKAKELGDANAEKVLGGMFLSAANDAMKAKKFNDAIAKAEKALAIGPNPTASLIAGMSAYQAKNFNKAITHLVNAPASAQNTYILASCYESAGKKAQACATYKKVLNDGKFGPTAKQKIAKLGC
ncbi:MAG: tetratricopeptide repeat protein [Bacteroidales bacterium]|nr:tetratricopeptide repeat protein [Bacteroidales bacterium]